VPHPLRWPPLRAAAHRRAADNFGASVTWLPFHSSDQRSGTASR
jgi:hypothetical protein